MIGLVYSFERSVVADGSRRQIAMSQSIARPEIFAETLDMGHPVGVGAQIVHHPFLGELLGELLGGLAIVAGQTQHVDLERNLGMERFQTRRFCLIRLPL